jgi:HK97 family phage prohead protease
MGQSIDTSGITTETYMKNPVVLYGHDYTGLPIGKCTSLKQFKNKMTAAFQLAVDEYDFAATVSKLVKGGYLNAVSIGGIIKSISPDWETIKEMEMVEFSIVPVPANSSALIARSLQDVTGKSQQVIAREYHDFVEKAFADKLSGVDNTELAQYIETIEKLLGILKANADKEPGSKPENEVIRFTLRKSANGIARTSEEIIRFIKAKE